MTMQKEEDAESYSNFFWMRRGEGEHVYCMLVRLSRTGPSRYAGFHLLQSCIMVSALQASRMFFGREVACSLQRVA